MLLVSHFADGSGAPRLLLNIARVLHDFGFNLHIVLLRDGELHPSFCHYGSVDVIRNKKEFEKKLEEWKFLGIRKAFLNTSVAGYYAPLLKRHQLKVITLVHEMWNTVTEMCLREAAENLLNYSDRIVLPSTLLMEDWAGNGLSFQESRIHIMPQPDFHDGLLPPASRHQRENAHTALCRELGIPANSFIVLGCGFLEHRKGVETFFKTAEAVIRANPNIHFIWIGDKGDYFYRCKIENLIMPISRNARLLSYRKLDKYYHGGDLFFLPSTEDPFPTVALLAAKTAMPMVFCRNSTGIRDLFGQVEGCSCERNSADDFSSMILRFAANPEFCRKQGETLRQIYLQKMPPFRDYVRKLYELAGDTLPKITAIVPNYNYAEFLTERIKSIASQTFPVYELLILDDCSTDDSARVSENLIREYASCFPGGARYVRNTENIGVFRQWQKGVQMASGEILWIAEADDSCRPEMLANLVHAFLFDPKVVLAYAQSALMDEHGEIYSSDFNQHTDMISRVRWRTSWICDGRTEIETALGIMNTIPNVSAVLFRKEAFAQIPSEIFSYRTAGDWFAYLHMISEGRIAFCATPLNLYRRHRDSVIDKNPERLLDEISTISELACRRFFLSDYSKYWNQKSYQDTVFLLKGDYSHQGLSALQNAAKQKKEDTDCLYIARNYSPSLLKRRLSETRSKYVFLCLEDASIRLSTESMEQSGAIIHLFWKSDIRTTDFFRLFRPLIQEKH